MQPFSLTRNPRDIRVDRASSGVQQLKQKDEFVRHIIGLWTTAQKSFLDIGRALNRAKEILDHGEFIEMVERELPFNRNIAFQIRAVAIAIDNNELPIERLPSNYSIIYQITTLTPEERLAAEEQCLIRPDLKRHEIIAFKQAIRSSTIKRRDTLLKERKKLLTERERIDQRLRELDEELRKATESDCSIADPSKGNVNLLQSSEPLQAPEADEGATKCQEHEINIGVVATSNRESSASENSGLSASENPPGSS